MRRLHWLTILFFAAGLCLLTSSSYAQPTPQLDSERPHWYSGFTRPYTPPVFPPVNLSNSTRLDSLVCAGKLYLSVSDAIASAIENTLDIEVESCVFPIAESDLLRVKSGASIRVIPTTRITAINTSSGVLILNC